MVVVIGGVQRSGASADAITTALAGCKFRLTRAAHSRAVVHLTRASAGGYDGRVIARRVGARKLPSVAAGPANFKVIHYRISRWRLEATYAYVAHRAALLPAFGPSQHSLTSRPLKVLPAWRMRRKNPCHRS